MSNMFLNVVSTFKGDGLSAATRQLGAFGKSAGGLGSTLGRVGAALASFGVATKAVAFTRESIDSARDLERNLFSVGTIFDDLSPKIVQFTKDAERLGLSQKDAAKASTFLGSVLKQSGFSMDFVTAETQKLVSLGVDLAATYGYDVQEALLGMTALFRGEYDPIEKFGVAMKQSEINSELAARGLDKLEGAARRNAEQTIRLELLYQRAADATGAFTAQSGNLYVEQKKLSAAWENMQATVGAQLLPVMGNLVDALRPLVDELTPRLVEAVNSSIPALQQFVNLISDSSDKTTMAGQTFGFLTETLNNLFSFISNHFGTIVTLTALFGGLRIAVLLVNAALATTPIGWIAIGLGALAASFLLVEDAAKKTETAVYNANVQMMKTDPIKQAIAPYRVYEGLLGDISSSTAVVTKKQQIMIDAVARADKAKLDNLRNQINQTKISATAAANEIRRMARYAGIDLAEPAATESISTATTTGATGAAKKAGQKAGNAYVSGVELALKANARKLQEILTKFTAETPIKDEWTEFGSTLGNQIIKGLSKSIERIGPYIGEQSLKAFKGIYKQAAALQDAFVARTQFQTKLKEDIMSMFDFKTIKTGLSGIIKQFKDQVAQTKKFRDNLVELQKLGLAGDLFRKIAEGQDFNAAAELVKGGAEAVSEVNSLYGQLQGFSNEIATVSGNALYNLGVDAATGFTRTLEDGFLSLQSLAELERKKAQVIAAQNSAAAMTPFNTGYSPDQIKAIREKAAADYQYYLGRFIDPITGQRREGVLRGPLQNAQLRSNLDQYFLGGGQMNGNIANQLSYLDLGRNAQIAAERAAREQARAERNGRSVTVNVNGGISTSAQIGQSVVEAIRAYERASGQVYASA